MGEPHWRVSSHTGTNNCVEVAAVSGAVGVRDSKRRDDGPVIAVGREAWGTLLDGIRR